MSEQRHKAKNNKAARKRAEVLRPTFELNLAQAELAKQIDLEAHGVTTLNALAKKLFLQYMEANR